MSLFWGMEVRFLGYRSTLKPVGRFKTILAGILIDLKHRLYDLKPNNNILREHNSKLPDMEY